VPGAAAVAGVLSISWGCSGEAEKSGEKSVAEEKPKPTATAGVEARPLAVSASASASAAPKKEEYGPMVTIPAGELKAGSRCRDIPRIRPHELVYESINMGEFQMDVYPYPNDPTQKAKVGVTHAQAAKLCAERGKRLCTELEWERACKGPKNTTYMWGDAFDAKKCPGRLDLSIGGRSACETEFGVKDMLGLGMEWTASSWERGTSSGDMVIRGARAKKVSWLSARCTHSRQRDPHKTYDEVGFRCCAGAANPAKVELRPKKLETLVDVQIDTPFEMSLMQVLPRDHRQIVGVELSFDNVFKWHPVANEELFVTRWVGKPAEGEPFYEVAVFKICDENAWRTAKMRGPVAQLSKPIIGISPTKLSFEVEIGDQKGIVRLSYWHGYIKVTEPSWIEKGNQLSPKSDQDAGVDGGAIEGTDDKQLKPEKGALKKDATHEEEGARRTAPQLKPKAAPKAKSQ